MPKASYRAVVSGFTATARDAGGIATAGLVAYSIPWIGGPIAYFLAPYVAGSAIGKSLSKVFALVFWLDQILESLMGGRGAF